jgi:hypothetical protein
MEATNGGESDDQGEDSGGWRRPGHLWLEKEATDGGEIFFWPVRWSLMKKKMMRNL